MYTLGINAAFDDPAACIVQDALSTASARFHSARTNCRSTPSKGELFIMAEQDNQPKREIDADEVIRDYVESGNQTTLPMQNDEADVEWYDQARLDPPIPADAVLSGGDIDAAWDQAAVGDETVGGSSPTPDQDIVDEIGKALGVTYADGEPLHTTEKIARRDEVRWELHPASSEDYAERTRTSETSQIPVNKPRETKRRPSSGKRAKRKSG
jgi:uncharacterized protein DUF6335